jgi:hypothetical protein
MLRTESRTLSMLGKHFTNWATYSSPPKDALDVQISQACDVFLKPGLLVLNGCLAWCLAVLPCRLGTLFVIVGESFSSPQYFLWQTEPGLSDINGLLFLTTWSVMRKVVYPGTKVLLPWAVHTYHAISRVQLTPNTKHLTPRGEEANTEGVWVSAALWKTWAVPASMATMEDTTAQERKPQELRTSPRDCRPGFTYRHRLLTYGTFRLASRISEFLTK